MRAMIVALALMVPSMAVAQMTADGWTFTNSIIGDELEGTEAAAPGTPAAGKVLLYPKSGTPGEWCSKDDAGVETCMSAGGGGGAPTTLDYLVGTATGSLSAEIAVGTTPGGELGGTWASPTIDSGVVSFGELAAGSAADGQVDGTLEENEIDLLDLLDTAAADTCIGNDYVKRNAGDTAFECAAIAGGFTSWLLDGDNNSPQTISDGNEALIAGGTNGIDTVASATDTVTINLDLSESPAGGELGGNLDAPTLDDNVTVAGWTLNTATITSPVIDLPGNVAPSPTTEGRIEWETDDDHLILGDGASNVEFVPAEDVSGDATMTDAGVVAVADDSHNHGASTISALDAGDTTTGTFADALINGANESDEVTGLTDGQISDTLTASTSTTAAANTNTTAIATTAFVQQEIDDGDFLTDNCILENDSTPIPDSCVGDGSDAGAGGGAPTTVDYLVGTADAGLSAEIVVGTTPGGELGNTWASPTLDDTITVSEWTIGGLNLSAGSASAGTWPVLTSGTVLTTAEDGAIEEDADAFYMTTDAGNRGYVPVKNCIRANATRTLTSSGSEQALFNSPTNGRLTLETGTYLFEGMFYLSGMSATSGNAAFDPLGAGTATATAWLWQFRGLDNTTVATVGAPSGQAVITQQTAASGVAAGTGTAMTAFFDGTFEITGAGTFIPSVTLVTAATPTVNLGSYVCVERIGSDAAVSIGQWD